MYRDTSPGLSMRKKDYESKVVMGLQILIKGSKMIDFSKLTFFFVDASSLPFSWYWYALSPLSFFYFFTGSSPAKDEEGAEGVDQGV